MLAWKCRRREDAMREVAGAAVGSLFCTAFFSLRCPLVDEHAFLSSVPLPSEVEFSEHSQTSDSTIPRRSLPPSPACTLYR